MTIPFNGYIAGDAFKGHPVIQYKPASPPPWGADAAGLGFVNSGRTPTGGSLARILFALGTQRRIRRSTP